MLDIKALLVAAADKIMKEMEQDKQEKREIMEKNIVKKENDESFIKGLVADYLTKVSPEIGEEFKKEHAIRNSTNNTLEEVVAHYQKQQSNKTKPKDPGHANKKHRKTSRKQDSSGSAQEKERTRHVHFSEEDDEFMLQQLIAGVSVTQIASCLGRAQPAVHNRIEKLRRNGSDHSRKSFTLEEDQMILDKALDELVKMSDKSLKLLPFHHHRKELAKNLNRGHISILQRWEQMRFWILSYYKGTLGKDIRTMLVDYLVSNYEFRSSIDWGKVSEVPEFSLHTPKLLKKEYCEIEVIVGRNIGVHTTTEVTLKQVGDYVASGKLKAKNKSESNRDIVIINYFEEQLEKKNIVVDELDLS